VLLDHQVQWPYALAMGMWRSRLVTGLLALAAAWGLWTTINIVRLGPRGSSPDIYWPTGALIAAVTCGLAFLVTRRVSRRRV
jgi:hypothetical protein